MPRILPGETDIYAITDSRLSLGRPLEEVASALLGAGVRILQYREKCFKGGEMLEECRLLRRLSLACTPLHIQQAGQHIPLQQLAVLVQRQSCSLELSIITERASSLERPACPVIFLSSSNVVCKAASRAKPSLTSTNFGNALSTNWR